MESASPASHGPATGPILPLHAWITSRPALQVFSMLVRVLLALAFLPSGLVKIRGEPFTALPVTDPVGYFFSGFFSAPGYYRFVGLAQWTAGALLLVPRTATLGALVYLPIIVNIFVITVTVDFGGTQAVTGLMLLANFWLLFWDYDRIRGIWSEADHAPGTLTRQGDFLTVLGMMVAASLGFFGVLGVHLGRLRGGVGARPLVMLISGAVLGGAMVMRAWKRARSARE